MRSRFWQLCRGMSLDEFVKLLQTTRLGAQFYVWDPGDNVAEIPDKNLFTWPIMYLLTYHHKHILTKKSHLNLEQVEFSLQQWENRLRWNLALHDQERGQWTKLKTRGPTPPCPDAGNPTINSFIKDTKDRIYKNLKWIRHRMHTKRQLCSNYSGIVGLALKILRGSPMVPIATDKDGGFCMVNRYHLKVEREKLMSREKFYKRIFKSKQSITEDVYEDFVNTMNEALADMDFLPFVAKKQLLNTLCRPWQHRSGNLISALRTTVKTHKPIATLRAIHASAASPLESAAKLLVDLLRPGLQKITHILKSSKQLVEQLATRKFSRDCKFVKIDVDEFFMSGTHSEFIRASVSLVEVRWQSLYTALVKFLLQSQYVENDSAYYRVLCGAGMGQSYSGELCDATLFCLAERGFTDNERAMQKLRVEAYWRFKDDILVISSGTPLQRNRFLEVFRIKCSIWKLSLDCVSAFSVPYLDLRIFKGARFAATGLLDTCVYHKPSALKRPLGISSGHPASVHASWPQGMVNRAYELCSSMDGVQAETRRLHSWFSSNFGAEWAKAVMRPRVAAKSIQSPSHTLHSYLVRPFRKEYEWANLRATLKRQEELWNSLHLRAGYLQLRLSYSLGGQHLQSTLEKYRKFPVTDTTSIFGN